MENKLIFFFTCCFLAFNLHGQNGNLILVPVEPEEMTDVYYFLFHHIKEGQEKPTNVVWLMNDTAILSQWQSDQFNIEGRYEYFDLTNDLVMYCSGNSDKRPVAYDMKSVTTFCDYVTYEPYSIRKIRYMDCSLAYAHNGAETYKMYINESFGIDFSPFAKIKGIPFYFEYYNPETGENYQQYVVRIKKSKVPVSYFNKTKNYDVRTNGTLFHI